VTSFAPRCVSIDLEVGREDGVIRRFAAVRGDTGEAFTYRGGDLLKALAKLDGFAEGAAFALGHNLIAFDAPHLEAAKPDLKLLQLPRVDTLRLNPLAFPRNPYHHLVKHYQDGQLKRGRVNDPELDARLTLDVFADQQRALREVAPDLLVAWHWLTGAEGFDPVFATIRRSVRPERTEAHDAIKNRLRGKTLIIDSSQAFDTWAAPAEAPERKLIDWLPRFRRKSA